MVHFRGNISHYVNWFNAKHSAKYIARQFEFIEKKLLHINKLLYKSELADAVIKAAEELEYKIKSDENYFGKSFLSQRKGGRWSMSDNLKAEHIITNALVQKVLIRSNTAYGVQVLKSGEEIECYARKGVIVSAGTYNSPKILQLSGIGPKNLLESLQIPVIKDLPVGENLQDHVTTGLDIVLFDNSLSVNAMNVLNVMNIYDYFFNGQGAFTSPGCEVVGFLSTKNESTADLQFMVLPVGISSDRGSHLRKTLRIQKHVWNNYFEKVFDKHTATILPIVLHPKSKGKVYINTKNPNMPPLIDPKYLSHEDDLDVLRNGLKTVLKFISTKAMKEIGGYPNRIPFPGCENDVLFSDEYLNCYIRHLTLTSFHPVGTCSMGLPDSNSVVDTSFRVFGVNRLYVVDGSVLPTLPSGNINAAIAMMASVFFDTNIINIRNTKLCYVSTMYEYVHNICIVEKL